MAYLLQLLVRSIRTSSILLFLSLLLCCNRSDNQLQTALSSKETKTGLASFYGQAFQGQETASGKTFDKNELVAAHPSYPMGTKVRVTNLTNEQTIEVRIIDRGPTPENQAEGIIIDLSKAAAGKLGMIQDGRVQVKTEVLEWGQGKS